METSEDKGTNIHNTILFATLIFAACVMMALAILGTYYKEKKKDYEELAHRYVGKKAIVDGDTVTITNYEYLLGVFKTSKGHSLSDDNMEEFIIKEKK